MKLLLGLFVVCSTSVAFAQSTVSSDFYIAQDSKSKVCQVVENRPIFGSLSVLSEAHVYKTRAQAEAVLASLKLCDLK